MYSSSYVNHTSVKWFEKENTLSWAEGTRRLKALHSFPELVVCSMRILTQDSCGCQWLKPSWNFAYTKKRDLLIHIIKPWEGQIQLERRTQITDRIRSFPFPPPFFFWLPSLPLWQSASFSENFSHSAGHMEAGHFCAHTSQSFCKRRISSPSF